MKVDYQMTNKRVIKKFNKPGCFLIQIVKIPKCCWMAVTLDDSVKQYFFIIGAAVTQKQVLDLHLDNFGSFWKCLHHFYSFHSKCLSGAWHLCKVDTYAHNKTSQCSQNKIAWSMSVCSQPQTQPLMTTFLLGAPHNFARGKKIVLWVSGYCPLL